MKYLPAVVERTRHAGELGLHIASIAAQARMPFPLVQVMADTADISDANTGWEWALINDMANQTRKERALADPDSWTRFDKSQEAMAGLLGGPDESKSQFSIWTEYGSDCECICRWPAPCGHGLWAFNVKMFYPGVDLIHGPRPRVLVRAAPAARLLVASLSETPSAVEIVFRSLAGDQVGESTRSKDEGDFLMEDLVELAEEAAEQENLLTSVNQKLCVSLDGGHHQLPSTAVLWSAGANQERGFPSA